MLHNWNKRICIFFMLLSGLVTFQIPVQARDMTLTAGIAPSFFSGNYGTNKTTDIFYLPFHLKAKSGNASFKATIPYLRVRTQGTIIAGGTVVGTAGGNQAATRSGLGDIWLESDYKWQLDRGTTFSPYVRLKLGTASRARGLGTGQNDFELGTGVQIRAGERFFPFAKLGYRFMGQPANLTLNDILTYKAGISYVAGNRHIVTVMFSGHQSTQPGFAAAGEIIGAWNYKANETTSLQLYTLLGVSNGSPDYGGGIDIRYSF